MSIDIQWAIANLATKSDIARLESALHEQRQATDELHDTINVDMARRLLETAARVGALEDYREAREDERRAADEDRRQQARRKEDRRRQLMTWAIAIISPLFILTAAAWKGIVALWAWFHGVKP